MKQINKFIIEKLKINSKIKPPISELSNILKCLPTNKEFIELLSSEGYDYTLKDHPSKEDLIDGLCDYVDYFIYLKYKDKYEYYNISGNDLAHWIILDPEDNLYKDGYNYKGKSDWKQLKWFKKLPQIDQLRQKIEKMTPELP